MFVSGCGNFNSGTPAQMAQAFQKLLALPDETKVWVGHEYTCKNCRFALFAEPDNAEIQRRLKWAESCPAWKSTFTSSRRRSDGDNIAPTQVVPLLDRALHHWG